MLWVLNLLYGNGVSFWFDSPLYISRGVILIFINVVFFCLKIFLTFTNSVDPDEMQHFIWAFTVCKSTWLGVS